MRTTSRRTPGALALALWAALALTSCGEKPTEHWIEDGRTDARILLAVDDATTLRAAGVLQRHLYEATGVMMRIAQPDEPTSDQEISVGWSREAKAAAPDLETDGFVWRSTGPKRLVIGGPGKGTLYGVCAFLEEHLGVRQYTPEVSHVPQHPVFDLPDLDETRRPAFPIRWVHMPAAEDQAWCDWHGVHSRPHREETWGMFVHTFEPLVDPEDHFEDHPEYFSLLKGRRVPNMQLCLTNEDVFQLVVEGLRRLMDR